MPQPIEPEVPYRAFSGANITAMVGNRKIGSLKSITCSTQRETVAVYAMGSANPKAFVKGKRGISGALVFSTFDRHALLFDVFQDLYNQPLSRGGGALGSSRALAAEATQGLLSNARIPTRDFSQAGEFSGAINNAFGDGVDSELVSELQDIYQLIGAQRLTHADQLPEFDITLTFANEAGDAAFCSILGVNLINEGWGYDLDDLTSETAHTYVARESTPLTTLTNEQVYRSVRNASLR